MRTTVDIDDVILKEIKALRKKQGKSLSRLISDLLAQSLRLKKSQPDKPAIPDWIARPMGARVNLADREAVYGVMEGPVLDQGIDDR